MTKKASLASWTGKHVRRDLSRMLRDIETEREFWAVDVELSRTIMESPQRHGMKVEFEADLDGYFGNGKTRFAAMRSALKKLKAGK